MHRPVKLLFITLVLSGAGVSASAYAGGMRPASANTLDYNYIRVGRVVRDFDLFDDRARGYTLDASWRFGDNVYLVGQASRLDFDKRDFDEDLYGVGIGYEENPQGDVSGFLQLTVFREETTQAPNDFDFRTDTWERISWGFRTLLGKGSPWELDGSVYYDARTDFGPRKFGVSLGIGAAWNHFGFRLVGNHNGDRESVNLSVSVFF